MVQNFTSKSKNITTKLLIWSTMVGASLTRPVGNEEYQQYGRPLGNSYPTSILPAGFGDIQIGRPGFGSQVPFGLPQPSQPSQPFIFSDAFGPLIGTNNYGVPGLGGGLVNFLG